eukprot:TRINITY_DN6730_c0_g2_i1.p1 TRINITY_DN6730_c0_g2~~TRINITY_DN6730_c0_g2_i1.p1  ORF type:complete len:564 (+),score=78.99 TRINITY_DN6730_c0_g2_i1:45-1736(+)
MRALVIAALAVCAAEGADPSTPTVHHMPDHGSISGNYSTPQEWIISCTRATISIDVKYTPSSGYNLTADGLPLVSGYDQRVACDSERIVLLYTPSDGNDHDLKINWAVGSVTVHHVKNVGNVTDVRLATKQEWSMSCSPKTDTIYVSVFDDPSGYNLTADNAPLQVGYDQPVPCPSSWEVSLTYTPYDYDDHNLTLFWSTAPVTVHDVSKYGGFYFEEVYYTAQEWVIFCTPFSHSVVTIDLFDWHGSGSGYNFTVDGLSVVRSGNQRAFCPSSGNISLQFTPYDLGYHAVRFAWSDVPVQYRDESDHGSVDAIFGSIPQGWAIPCTPGGTMSVNVTSAPSGYDLVVDGVSLSAGLDQRVTCPSSRTMALLYTGADGPIQHHLMFSWSFVPPTPDTPIPVTVHIMPEEGSISGNYSTAQEWLISCKPGGSVSVVVNDFPEGTFLAADSRALFRAQYSVFCHSIAGSPWQFSLVYYPLHNTGILRVTWAPESQEGSQGMSLLLIALIVTAGVLLAVGTAAVYCVRRRRVGRKGNNTSSVGEEVHGGREDDNLVYTTEQPPRHFS